mmetsp:Transcript_1727/g.5002  ORF Transcript_1727/g.5002 Transcript_1727/m.5002 type:complete len:204 (-) Transcript_1727:472-1083(-)
MAPCQFLCTLAPRQGLRVFTTKLGLRVLQTRVNFVNPSSRTAAGFNNVFEGRLVKYCQRGFAICVPGLEEELVEYQANEMVKEPSGLRALLHNLSQAMQPEEEGTEELLMPVSNLREYADEILANDLYRSHVGCDFKMWPHRTKEEARVRRHIPKLPRTGVASQPDELHKSLCCFFTLVLRQYKMWSQKYENGEMILRPHTSQ